MASDDGFTLVARKNGKGRDRGRGHAAHATASAAPAATWAAPSGNDDAGGASLSGTGTGLPRRMSRRQKRALKEAAAVSDAERAQQRVASCDRALSRSTFWPTLCDALRRSGIRCCPLSGGGGGGGGGGGSASSTGAGASAGRGSVRARGGDGAPIVELVCYGVGSFATSDNAATQLACAARLATACAAPEDTGSGEGTGSGDGSTDAGSGVSSGSGVRRVLFDPILTAAEVQAARGLGWQVLSVNEECRRLARATATHAGGGDGGGSDVEGRTLFFMPHCGKRMYANLVHANWVASGAEPNQLRRVVIVGNSFAEYKASAVAEPAPGSAEALLVAALPLVMEEPVRPGDLMHVFNNTSVHTFKGLDSAAGGVERADADAVALAALLAAPPELAPLRDRAGGEGVAAGETSGSGSALSGGAADVEDGDIIRATTATATGAAVPRRGERGDASDAGAVGGAL